MQRLHVDDLCGSLLRASNDWALLRFSAIAEEDEQVQVGEDDWHTRRHHQANLVQALRPTTSPRRLVSHHPELGHCIESWSRESLVRMHYGIDPREEILLVGCIAGSLRLSNAESASHFSRGGTQGKQDPSRGRVAKSGAARRCDQAGAEQAHPHVHPVK